MRWRADGNELFYVDLEERLMAIPIRVSPNVPNLEIGDPVPLFTVRVGASMPRIDTDATVGRQQYIVSPDGQRFLVDCNS